MCQLNIWCSSARHPHVCIYKLIKKIVGAAIVIRVIVQSAHTSAQSVFLFFFQIEFFRLVYSRIICFAIKSTIFVAVGDFFLKKWIRVIFDAMDWRLETIRNISMKNFQIVFFAFCLTACFIKKLPLCSIRLSWAT